MPSDLSEEFIKTTNAVEMYRRKHAYYIIGLFLSGVTASICASIGLKWWCTADYFYHLGNYPVGWVGYDAFTFSGLVLFVTFSSIGVTLLYSSISALIRLWCNFYGLALYSLLGVIFILAGCRAMEWGKETMQCFGIFCINKSNYVEYPGARPEAGLGFLSVVGITAFLSFTPMGLVIILQAIVKYKRLDKKGLDPNRQRLVIYHNFTLLQASAAYILLLSFSLVTFYLPNSWEYFTAPRIASNSHLIAVRDATLCSTQWKNYTCPELPWSWVFTRNWVWSDSLVLKMYPSNIFFFSYLLIVLLTVTVIRGSRGGRNFLKRRCPSVLRAFSYGEAAFAVLTTLMLLLFFAYWVSGHNFNGYWKGGDNANILDTERWARSFGQLAVAFMSLCVFPASRYSVLHSILGTSWESSLWVHKVLGYGMLLATAAHMVLWYIYFGQTGSFPHDVFSIPMTSSISVDNFTVPLISLVTWFMFVAIGVFSLEPVRRRFFELFYYLHMLAFYMIVPCVLWHAAAAWEYLLPGLTVWFVDRMVRMYRSASTAEVVSAIENGAYVQIQFLHSTLCAGPGQYAFVNIPELSLLQWHPFSLSVSREGCYAFHIKSMGEGTWTGRLVQLVKDRGSDFSLSVDGPCGRVQDFTDYKSVVLVAGGIGVTPCATIYSYLRRQRALTGKGPAVTLLWTLRDAELLTMMSHLWDEVDVSALKCGCAELSSYDIQDFEMPLRIFLTGEAKSCNVVVGSAVIIERERPSLHTEICRAVSNVDGCDVLIFACGPSEMVKVARGVGVGMGANFHEECFLL